MLINLIKHNHKINNLFSRIFIVAVFILFALSIINFSNSNFLDDSSNRKCANFVNPSVNYQENFEIVKNDIYVFPQINNLFCLNKIINNGYSEDTQTITVGTNSKIVNLVIAIYLLAIYFFSFKNNISIAIIYYIFVLIGLIYNFYFSLNFFSLNTILFFTFLIINNYLKDKNSVKIFTFKKPKSTKFVNIFVFSFYLLFIILTQFSTHNFETMDWDINSFIVTSMDLKNGQLPFESHYENKPPLLFINYFLFSSIADGNLLILKILNDILIFIIVVLLHFLVFNKNRDQLLSIFCSLIFIILMSKDWFHPGYSELHSLFYLVLSIYFFERNYTNKRNFLSATFFSFATLCNLGSVIFIIPFIIVLYFRERRIIKPIIYLISFSIPHTIFLIIYSLRGSFENYIVSMLSIPRNYPRVESSQIYELGVFIQGINDFSIFINILIIYLISKICSQIFINDSFFTSFKNLHLQLLLFSFLFYFLASIGYQHHLIFLIFFISYSGVHVFKEYDYYILIPIILISMFTIGQAQFDDSFKNIKDYQNIQKNYPLFNASNIYFANMTDEDRVLSFDNFLLLYYLEKDNDSYISHPALYTATFVIEPLSELNLVDLNEVESSIGNKPKYIICSNIVEFCNDLKNYKLVETKEVESLNFHYYQSGKKLKLFEFNN